MTATRAAQAATIALLAALVLSGCGRKGPLDIPQTGPVDQTEEASDEQKKKVKNRRFILDPLIE